MRRVAGFVVAVVVVLSSPIALASGDAISDLGSSIHALAHAKTATVATVDPARGVDVGISGVNVTRDAKTGGDVAATAAEQNAATTPSAAGLHH